MIGTLVRISWLNLKRDRLAMGLTFILPIVFFSIFAMIFGSMSVSGGGGDGAMRVIVVDQDQTEVSRRFVEAIDDQDALKVVTKPHATEENPDPAPFDRDGARAQIVEGNNPAAIVIPEGFGATFGSFGGDAEAIELIYDSANPIAQHSISGLMQAAAMMAAPDILMESGLEQLELFGGGLTEKQREAVDFIKPFLRGDRAWEELDEDEEGGEDGAEESSSDDVGFTGLVQVQATAARADEEGQAPPMVAYYAAGIGVMFLLFSMAGAGGSILEEEETGTLERLLSSNVSMGVLLLSNWMFFALIGIAQVTLMFLWGALIFGLDLFTANHLAGFIAMTMVTGAAAAAFGIVLATLCRSRAQLGGMSTIIILIMSALGGSMVPRFIMPAFMDDVAKFTFNGWALDGYLKVFWQEREGAGVVESLIRLSPQLAVLGGMTIAFLLIARLVARRWETA